MRLAGAAFNAQGTNLTVTSDNVQVSFAGADVVGISNQLTGESYLRNPATTMQLNLELTEAPSQALAASGPWNVDSAGASASLTLTDSNRTVAITVSIDPATQEVVVDLNGHAQQGGVQRLTWGITGFDLTMGRFVLPARGGLSLTGKSFSAQRSYSFSSGSTPNFWEAPLSLFQTGLGGVAIFSTDTLALGKDLSLGANQQQTANESFIVEAPGPWNTAMEAGPIEWRLAAYQGDWQVGARIYRDWHNAAMPPMPLTGARSWANSIRTVITVVNNPPYQNSIIDALPAALVPSETLLYLSGWRSHRFGIDYPDYTPDPSLKGFVSYAHKLGFYVMLDTEEFATSMSNSDYAAVQQFQIRDPLTLQPRTVGTGANTAAFINPAASAYRKLFVQRITPAIQTVNPDAITLGYYLGWNDGNGPIEGMNFNQGAAQLHRDMLAVFPNLVLGTDTPSDAVSPFGSFAQPYLWESPFSADTTPPVPISAYVLPNVNRYWYSEAPNANESGFLAALQKYEGQAVLPTFHTGVADYSQPDIARFMKVVTTFQKYNLQPAWDTNWNGALMSYQGANGASATLTDTGALLQFNVQQQSGASSVLYARAHTTDRVDSPLQVANWPAYNGTLTIGLDPANIYWLDPPATNPALVHVTSLPTGVKLGLGTGTLVTPDFAYFQLLPPSASTPFDFFANFGLANTGFTYNGADFTLASNSNAQVYLSTVIVGGESRQAINTKEPNGNQLGGETFIEYNVPVAVGASASLSFATGILDTAIGLRTTGPMTFKVELNGAILWQQDVSTGGWQPGAIDLSAFLGQTVKIRFVSNPGPSGSPFYGWGAWSALQLSVAANDVLGSVTLAVPPALTSSNLAVTGGSVTVNSGVAAVSGLPAGGTVLVFTGKPKQVIAGTTLLGIPPTVSLSLAGGMADPPPDPTLLLFYKASTLYSFSLTNGQTILSWYLQLPASPNLALSFGGGVYPAVPPPQLSLRVNGTVLWYLLTAMPTLENVSIDLSPWSGQTVLLELIDSRSIHQIGIYDTSSWLGLTFGAAGSANCTASLSPSSSISVPAAGATGTISVTTASACGWIAAGEADWITATPSSAAGNGTVTYTIAANTGPSRQSMLVIAGELVTVTQAAAPVTPAPVTPPVSSAPVAAPFNFLANFSQANTGITYNGADFPVASNANARVFLSTVAVGGESRLAIHTQEPSGDQIGGETFIEYTVPTAAGASASLAFATGILRYGDRPEDGWPHDLQGRSERSHPLATGRFHRRVATRQYRHESLPWPSRQDPLCKQSRSIGQPVLCMGCMERPPTLRTAFDVLNAITLTAPPVRWRNRSSDL